MNYVREQDLSYVLPYLSIIAEKILDPDPQNDNKVCGRNWFSTERVFVLRDSDADEVDCQEKCVKDQNCVAMSGIWGQWCIGCSEPLNVLETGALSFRKGK